MLRFFIDRPIFASVISIVIVIAGAAALRALRQKEMGEQLAAPLDDDEAQWLDASLR